MKICCEIKIKLTSYSTACNDKKMIQRLKSKTDVVHKIYKVGILLIKQISKFSDN